jgi:hypothetical protein
MVYVTDSGQKLRVHDHASDQSCHWTTVFKPLAFVVFHHPVLIQSLSQSSYCSGKELGDVEYARWLCELDNRGFLNLLNVLLHVCELRGIPDPPL